jgi:uncharacterized HhH-GPD family protein
MIDNAERGVSVTGSVEADTFLRANPDGLLYAALLDQQMRAELAFIGPYRLRQRLGGLDVQRIANMELERLVTVFLEKPGIHRFGRMMAERARRLAEYMVRHHDGTVTRLYADVPPDVELVRRFAKLPGFGKSKAGVLVESLALFGHRPLTDG